MMDLDAKEVLSTVKIIDLDAEVLTEKAMVAFVSEIDSDGIHMAIVLINQYTTVLFQIVVLASEI